MAKSTKAKLKSELGLHEVLHMSSFLVRAVDEELLGHAEIRKRRKLTALATKASNALASLYLAIANEK